MYEPARVSARTLLAPRSGSKVDVGYVYMYHAHRRADIVLNVRVAHGVELEGQGRAMVMMVR